MAQRDEHGQVLVAKVVLVGVPDSGKSAILRQMAERYAHASLRADEVAGADVFRTEFFWPDAFSDGRRLRVRLFAVSGHPAYNAVDELLLEGCDGVVFVTKVEGEQAAAGRDSLRTLVFNAGRNGFELDSRPVVLQYSGVDKVPGFRPEQMDEWLGVPPGSVARFASGSQPGEDLCQGVEWVVEWVQRELARDEEPVAS